MEALRALFSPEAEAAAPGTGSKGFSPDAEVDMALSRPWRWAWHYGLLPSLPKDVLHSFPGAGNF